MSRFWWVIFCASFSSCLASHQLPFDRLKVDEEGEIVEDESENEEDRSEYKNERKREVEGGAVALVAIGLISIYLIYKMRRDC